MIRLRVPGVLKYRDLAIRTVAAACKLADEIDLVGGARILPPAFDDEVISAFSEAFNNVAIHSYKDRPIGDVEIEVEVKADRVTIRLTDYGSSFDISSVPAPDLDSMPESGLGIFIITSFMDDVVYTPGCPNVLVLTKYLGNGHDKVASRNASGVAKHDSGQDSGTSR